MHLLVSVLFLSMIAFGGFKLFVFCKNSIKTHRFNEDVSHDYEQVESDVQENSDYLSQEMKELSLQDQFKNEDELYSIIEEDASREYSLEASSVTQTIVNNNQYQIIRENIQMSMRKLYKRNNDLIGWLSIKGVLYLPVVYRDNTYYLDHDFDGRKNKSGTLFLDENHPFKENTQHLVIHGHDMVDGSMFGLLIHYRNLNYITEHGIINFNTLYDDERYAVYAVIVASSNVHSERFFPYIGLSTFSSENEFLFFLNKARKSSLFNIPIDVRPSDALLTLSTCLDDDRVLVLFRRIRDNEDEEDVQKALLFARVSELAQ